MSIHIRARAPDEVIHYAEIPYVPGEQGTDLKNRVTEILNQSVRFLVQRGREVENSAVIGDVVDPSSPVFALLGEHLP